MLGRMMPALQIRTSRRPNSLTALSTKVAQSDGLETSTGTERARPPAARISAAAESESALVRALVTTAAPASATPFAIARPRPRPEPVTTATLPERLKRASDMASVLVVRRFAIQDRLHFRQMILRQVRVVEPLLRRGLRDGIRRDAQRAVAGIAGHQGL